MEKNVSSLKISNIILCVILLITFVIVGTRTNVKANEINNNDDEVYPSVNIQLGNRYPSLIKSVSTYKEESLVASNIILDSNYYIKKNIDTIKFFATAFGYDLNDVINDLTSLSKNEEVFIRTNIGYLKNKSGKLYVYDNFEYGLIEYFYNLNNNGRIKKNKKYIPYEGNSKYVEDLITYYSSIYQNVDKTTLLSIGAAESGYYKVKYMLKYNNIYGGMSSKGLIKHNNIELGVLTFVRMMSRNYYGKGLTTPKSIGKVYCPVYIDGVKVASPHWINLVNTAKNKYSKNNDNITINDLINKVEAI